MRAIYKLDPFELGDEDKLLEIEIENNFIDKLLCFCNSCLETSLYKDPEFQKPINRFERHLKKIKVNVEENKMFTSYGFDLKSI